MNHVKFFTAILLGITTFVVAAADDLPPGVTLVKPDQMKWVKSATGRENAYLLGHPNKPAVPAPAASLPAEN